MVVVEISSWVTHWARWCPNRRAISDEGRDLSWRQLEHDVATIAGTLRDSGIAPGERIAYLGPNTAQLLQLVFAVARIGAILVPFNARMPATELRVFAEDCESRLLVAESSTRELAAAVVDASATALVTFDSDEELAPIISRSADPLQPGHEVPLSAPLLIMYTSLLSGDGVHSLDCHDGTRAWMGISGR